MSSTQSLGGYTALVTGGGGGIGLASAEALLRDGASVVLMGRRQEVLEAARERLLATVPDGRVDVFAGDALGSGDVEAAARHAHSLQGRLDIVVPTVGGGGFKPLMMQDVEGLRRELDLNITSAFLAIRYCVPLMSGGGSIVCISSTAAHMPFPWLSGYCAGKAGLEALIRSAADELAPASIRINAVRPGLTRSDATGDMFASPEVMTQFRAQIPLGRAGEPEDIAGGVRYLAGPEAAWVTGQCFNIDGGQCLRRHPDMTDAVALTYGEDALAAAQSGQPFSPNNTDTE